MTGLEIAALYSGILVILLVVLAFIVTLNRRRTLVSLGTGADEKLEQAVRAHANAIENAVPGIGALILLALVNAPVLALHILGGGLVAGRLLHAQGLLSAPGRSFGRLVGTLLSWLALLGMGCLLIISAF